ncbi:MAG: class I SAM-dependent rRNA methyltransferase [Ilumatobacteraceae bacterium]
MTGPLAALPGPNPRRIAVRITKDALRQVRHGSPWIYDGSILSAGHDGDAGDLAVVFDDRRRFAAIGMWDPTSPIRIKVLHVGEPASIDVDFWRRRSAAAVERRATLPADPTTDGYRLINGENDGFPGMVVDAYGSTLVAKIYTPAWFRHLASVIEVLEERPGVERVVLRLGRSVAAGETFGLVDGSTVVGVAPTGPVVFRERGLLLEADVVRGQKTGHFLDQRDNRSLVRSMASGLDVLDVFASTGGFSVAAAAGGARSVHLVDQSAPALEAARRNFARNERSAEVRRCSVRTTVADAFAALTELGARGERYDLVIVDPPSFASNQGAVPRALAAYARLTRLATAVIAPGGTLVQASCSSRVPTDDFVRAVLDAADSAGRPAHLVRRTGHAIDHPIGFPQGEYLKAVQLRL